MIFWSKLNAIFSLFILQIIRLVFEIVRTLFFLICFIPMLVKDKAYFILSDMFYKELSDFEEYDEIKNEDDGQLIRYI